MCISLLFHESKLLEFVLIVIGDYEIVLGTLITDFGKAWIDTSSEYYDWLHFGVLAIDFSFWILDISATHVVEDFHILDNRSWLKILSQGRELKYLLFVVFVDAEKIKIFYFCLNLLVIKYETNFGIYFMRWQVLRITTTHVLKIKIFDIFWFAKLSFLKILNT